MNLNISDEYFGELLPFIKKDSITDITWNGRDLWLDDLEKGRYKSAVKLSDQFIATFSTRIANLANKNFNLSEPLLEAETDNLRISIVDDTVTNTQRSIAIRKTPAVRRLNELKMIEDGYAEATVLKLLKALVRGHSSVIVTGDVGSGKTELIKYLTKFIPPYERAISIEDNYELRLSAINPKLDCVEIKATQDGPFSYQMAIKAALRQLCKWLLMAEARSKEVVQLLEAASTGCIVMTTLHSDDVRKIPDRVVNMMGIDGEEKRNDVYNFFDVGIKVGIQKTDKGIKRSIDQICVLDRDNNENALYLIYNKGFTGQTLPRNLWQKVAEGAKEEINLFEFLKPENADVTALTETPEFADMVSDLEQSMREELIKETKEEELMDIYGETETSDVEDLMGIFDEAEEEVTMDELIESAPETFDKIFEDVKIEDYISEVDMDEYLAELQEDAREEKLIDEAEDIDSLEDILETEDTDSLEDVFEAATEEVTEEPIEATEEPVEVIEEPIEISYAKDLDELFASADIESALEEVMDDAKDIESVMEIFDKVDAFEGMGREELVSELKKQITINWLNSLSTEELAEELRREVALVEDCNKRGVPIPEDDLIKINLNTGVL